MAVVVKVCIAFIAFFAWFFSQADSERLPAFSQLKAAFPADSRYGGLYPGDVLMDAVGAGNDTIPDDICPLRISTTLNLISGHIIAKLPYGLPRDEYHYNTYRKNNDSWNVYFFFSRDGLIKHLVRMYGLPLESVTPTTFLGMQGIMVLNITETRHEPCSVLLWDRYNFYQAYGFIKHTNLSRVYFWQTPDEPCQINIKKDALDGNKGAFCFPSMSKVELETGDKVAMKDVQIGDKVKTMTKEGAIKYTPVITFLDKVPAHHGLYFTIMTSSGKRLTMKPAHLIFRLKPDMTSERLFKREAVHAAKIRHGDLIYTQSSDQTRADRVVGVGISTENGAYAPVTYEGTLFVDDVLVSCFADFEDHDMAHYLMGPIRMLYNLVPNSVGAKGHYVHGYLRDVFRPVAVRWFGKDKFFKGPFETEKIEADEEAVFILKQNFEK